MSSVYFTSTIKRIFVLVVGQFCIIFYIATIVTYQPSVMKRLDTLHKFTSRNDLLAEITSSVPHRNFPRGLPVDHFQANQTWLFQRRLRRLKSKYSKVLVSAYMRSGSTLVSRLFTADEEHSIYWFEPILPKVLSLTAQVSSDVLTCYRRTTVDQFHLPSNTISDLLSQLFNCELDRLPIELFTHQFSSMSSVRRTFECIQRSTAKETPLLYCVSHLFRLCNKIDPVRMRACALLIEQFRNSNSSTTDLTNETLIVLRDLELEVRRSGLANYLLVGMHESEGSSVFEWFSLHRRCLRELEMASQRHNCVELSRDLCQADLNPNGNASNSSQRTLIVVKVIRSGLRLIEDTLRNNPDLTVVHLVRDPRAMAASRHDTETTLEDVKDSINIFQPSVTQLARILCARLLEDLRTKKRLDAIYPGAVMTIRYEDFVKDPHSIAKRMIEHVGHRISSEKVDRWINKYVSNSSLGKDGGLFDIVRKNPQSHITKWRTKVNEQQLRAMNEHCRLVLEELEYPI